MKVALIKVKEFNTTNYDSYEDLHLRIAESITDWADIEDDEWTTLWNASRKYGYLLVGLPEHPQQEIVFKTIQDFKAFEKAEKKKQEAERAAYELANKAKVEKAKQRKLDKLKQRLKALEAGS